MTNGDKIRAMSNRELADFYEILIVMTLWPKLFARIVYGLILVQKVVLNALKCG